MAGTPNYCLKPFFTNPPQQHNNVAQYCIHTCRCCRLDGSSCRALSTIIVEKIYALVIGPSCFSKTQREEQTYSCTDRPISCNRPVSSAVAAPNLWFLYQKRLLCTTRRSSSVCWIKSNSSVHRPWPVLSAELGSVYVL